MRKATNKKNCKASRKSTLKKRLALLATLVVTSTIGVGYDDQASAANPGFVSRATVPPLPVTTHSKSGVKNNPFVKNREDAQDRSVRLASGDNKPAIRLRPVGAPIGLNTIGEDPVRVRPSTIAIDEAMPPSIQQNPLVGSSHHDGADLVNVPASPIQGTNPQSSAENNLEPCDTLIPEFRPPAIECQPPVTDAAKAACTSHQESAHIVRPSEAPVLQAAPEIEIVASGDSAPRSNQEGACYVSLADEEDKKSTDTTKDQPQIQLAVDARDNREPIAESQPIFFSISDSDEIEHPCTEFAREATPVELNETPVHDTADRKSSSLPQTSSAPKSKPSDSIALETPDPKDESSTGVDEIADQAIPTPVMADEPIAPIQLDDESEAPPVAINIAEQLQPAPKAIYRSEPAVAAPVPAPEPTLARQRFRPPVAVDSPPIAVVRSGTSAMPENSVAAVQSAEAPVLEQEATLLEKKDEIAEHPESPRKGASHPAVLRMSRAQVRSLTIGGYVRRVAVGDKNICQAFAAGPNQLKLIGTGNGVTRLVVWADKSDSSPTSVRRFDVYVEDKAAASESTADKATVLNESIRRAFPTSHVFVQQMKDALVVNGHCDDEETAKKIVRMIRKTCLIPVRDEIQVR